MRKSNPLGWLYSPRPYYYGKRVGGQPNRKKWALVAIPLIFGVLAINSQPLFKKSSASLSAQPVAAAAAVRPETSKDQSQAFAIPINDQGSLQIILNKWVADHPDHKWSVVIRNNTIQTSINTNSAYNSASVYKLLLTYKLFQLYTPEGLAAIQVNVPQRGLTSAKDCVELMIKVSDNPCGEAIGNLEGWGRADQALKQLGLTHTKLNNSSGPTTTAADVALYLDKLRDGQLFNESTRQYVMDLMQKQTFRKGLPAGCGDCSVADKTGDLGFVRHDAGIVTYPNGQYVLSVFTDGAPYSQIAELTSQVHKAISNN